ncbi:hypothetical protein ASD98_03700 [Flavobacterium sp. Root186]|nr:hypothetical protein ASD98_03700 [Flavobacterium sp. Root186]
MKFVAKTKIYLRKVLFEIIKNLRVQIIENYRYKGLLVRFKLIYFGADAKGLSIIKNICFKIVIKLIFFASVSRKILFLPFTKLILNGYLQ